MSVTASKRTGGRSTYPQTKMSSPGCMGLGSGPGGLTMSPTTEPSGDFEVREEYDRVERWLDEHPEFVHDYFARKARRSMVDGWLIAHALSHSGLGAGVAGDTLSTSSNTSSNSKPSSGANTPVRKISAQEFREGWPAATHYFHCGWDPHLSGSLTSFHTDSFQQDPSAVQDDSTYEEICERDEEIRVPWGTGIIGYVAETGESVNIPDAYQDPRFNSEIDVKMGYKTRSILSMPIKDSEGEVIGVAQAINKISVKDEPFDEHDEKVFASYLAFCGIGLKNAQLYGRSLLENRRNQVLLDLASVIFEEQSNVANLIHKIMMHTQSLLQCQRCQVLLVDDASKDKNKRNCDSGTFSQAFDLQASDFDNDDTYNREGPQEPRFPINIGITGHVARTGETLNIPDVYADDRFDPTVDTETGFVTKSILCMPIKNVAGKVIGVIQLVNKLDNTNFNKNDENLFEAFAIFCGMGIHNTWMYETAVKAIAKQRVALEVMSYHAMAPMEEAERLKKMPVPSSQHYNLLDYNFHDFTLDDDDTLKATIRMFLDLELFDRFQINYELFCRFLLSVKKNYRNVTYHNWRHAFNVTQTMFCMLKTGQMANILGDMERLALMVGCLCHDLDHRGTNNQFQLKTMSPLAELYSTSTMEHHHFDQCIMIISTKGSDILCNVAQAEYEQVIQMLENAILSTDLALYFRFRGQFFELTRSSDVDWRDDSQRDLLRSMMMTASDVAAITKPWEVQKKVAELVASEFFEQGDLEKEELKIQPIAMARVSTKLSPLLQGCQQNRSNWLLEAETAEKNQSERHRQAEKQAEEQRAENSNKDNDEKTTS
ncbi:hypothetical protein C0Q70_00501 [Pomacea canaliculata]|uniref:Phosphodiesterase n=1 Tax=Pomacea canaliculata TaxID=400727 RepID=A0A2T7PWV6_POMCA|nr:hypothetical protein C0Q70_00501 [Pomacea canaliculata]